MPISSEVKIKKLAVEFAEAVTWPIALTANEALRLELQGKSGEQLSDLQVSERKRASSGLALKSLFYLGKRAGVLMSGLLFPTPERLSNAFEKADQIRLQHAERTMGYLEKMGNVPEDVLIQAMDAELKTTEGLEFARSHQLPRMASLIQKSLS